MSPRGKSASPESRLEIFLRRLRAIVGDERFEEVKSSLSGPRCVGLRVNTLRATAGEITSELEAAGAVLEPLAWYENGFLLRRGSRRELEETGAWREGKLYWQDPASMVPPLVLDPRPGDVVLDMAAAPGSKTTQIACLMGGEGRLVANDRSRSRFFRLKSVVEKQGAPGVELQCRPGETFGRTHPDVFDRVLVDAPCSGEGRFRLDRRETWRDWTPGKVQRCARLGRRLLAAAVRAARPGGSIVYSTCTFAPEENEAVVQKVLERSGGRLEVEAIGLPVDNVIPARTEWEGRRFDPAVARCARILPTAEREGFFVARLRRLA
jgi:16S rRNA (cytosine1407-C5)-methyltransferase